MKKIYTLILSLLFLGTSLNAQLSLSKAAYEPTIGDSYLTMGYDSTSAIPKTTGTGQLWSFTTFSAQITNTESITYTTVASTPASAIFSSSATMCKMRINGSNTQYEYNKSSGSILEYVGSYDTSGPQTTTFSNTGIIASWPISLTSSNSDAFAAVQTSTSSTVTMNGNYSYTATGAGTVILPGGNVHTNCLQVRTTLTISMIQGTNTSTYSDKTYTYYSASVKAPIIEINYQSQTSGTNTSTGYNIYVNTSAQSVGLTENKSASADFIVYPNPANEKVNIFLPDNEIPRSIEIIDMLGRVVTSSNNSVSVITSSLSKGLYSIRVNSKNGTGQKSLMITE